MPFDPHSVVVQKCLELGRLIVQGHRAQALELLEQWQRPSFDDFELFLVHYFSALAQSSPREAIDHLQHAVDYARASADVGALSALPALCNKLAELYDLCGEKELSDSFRAQAREMESVQFDPGPFYHGTKADLRPGDELLPGHSSNYQSGLEMNHIYFTALAQGAGLAAALAKGQGGDRVYVVEPKGEFEPDPNVTNKKFPGNLTRSYRSTEALRVLSELQDWQRLDHETVSEWRSRIDKNQGEIIN